jgi:hypothetical protein
VAIITFLDKINCLMRFLSSLLHDALEEGDMLEKIFVALGEVGLVGLAVSIVYFALLVILETIRQSLGVEVYPDWFFYVWEILTAVSVVFVMIGFSGFFITLNFIK